MDIIFGFGLAVGIIGVVASSVWIAIDAEDKKISTDRKPYGVMNGRWAWSSACVLLWIVVFPYYLYRRNEVLTALNSRSMPSPSVLQPVSLSAISAHAIDFDESLRKLAKLKEEGVLTEEEFTAKKRIVLGIGQEARAAPAPLQPFSAVLPNQVNHTLVWVNAFVPLFSIILRGILYAMGLTHWLSLPIIVGINIMLLHRDEQELKSKGLDTKGLGNAGLVPVYLFKRVQIVGGGYGYAICWMITFFISLL